MLPSHFLLPIRLVGVGGFIIIDGEGSGFEILLLGERSFSRCRQSDRRKGRTDNGQRNISIPGAGKGITLEERQIMRRLRSAQLRRPYGFGMGANERIQGPEPFLIRRP